MDGSWTLEPIAELDAPARVEPTWTPERIAAVETALGRGGDHGRDRPPHRRHARTRSIGKVHRIGLVPRIVKEAPPPRRNVFEFTGPACMWPIGHPTDNDFHFCGGRPVAGKPYCEAHTAERLYPA